MSLWDIVGVWIDGYLGQEPMKHVEKENITTCIHLTSQIHSVTNLLDNPAQSYTLQHKSCLCEADINTFQFIAILRNSTTNYGHNIYS